MKKIRILIITVLVVMCVLFVACFIENEPPNYDTVQGGYGEPLYDGPPIEGTGQGHNGPLKVTITLENGKIKDVELNIGGETYSNTRRIPNVIPPIIIRTNSFNYASNIVSGATYTGRGIKEAGKNALLQIPGVTEEDLKNIKLDL